MRTQWLEQELHSWEEADKGARGSTRPFDSGRDHRHAAAPHILHAHERRGAESVCHAALFRLSHAHKLGVWCRGAKCVRHARHGRCRGRGRRLQPQHRLAHAVSRTCELLGALQRSAVDAHNTVAQLHAGTGLSGRRGTESKVLRIRGIGSMVRGINTLSCTTHGA